MVAYAAVSWQARTAEKPTLGSVKLEADTKVSTADRLVNFSTLKITESNFPQVQKEQVREVTDEITRAIPDHERIIGLDRVLASVDTSKIIPREVKGLKAEPPAIFYSETPAVLMNLDGEPIWSQIANNDLKYAVNTNWDLFHHEPTKTYYLRHNESWLKAAAVNGPWEAAGKLPASFGKLPADDNWKEVKAALPGKALAKGQVPTVYRQPGAGGADPGPRQAELPAWSPTRSCSGCPTPRATCSAWARPGRSTTWWPAAGSRRPTSRAPGRSRRRTCPRSSTRCRSNTRARACSPRCRARSRRPRRCCSRRCRRRRASARRSCKAPDVAYQGDPKFEPVPTTTVERAVNTDKDIIKVGDLYYMCFQGVWFMAKTRDRALGSHQHRAQGDLQIPASSPSHNVTYVTVEDDDDNDEWVTFATVAGYTGVMVA